MSNIKPKKEVEQAVHDNLNRFAHAKKAIIEMNLNRDEAIIISSILPRLRHTIALTHYVRGLEWFYFSLPMMDFEGYDLSPEEKDAVIQAYYHQEGVLWTNNGHRGEIGKASLVKEVFEEILQTNVSFQFCEINLETNMVDFKLHLVDKMLKMIVKEERVSITAVMDEYLLPHLHFNSIADKINACYETLMEEELFVLYKNDLTSYPILSLNMDEILSGTDFYVDVELADPDFKIDIRQYVKESKLIKSLNRKLKNYGYALRYMTTNFDDWFRSNGINISVDASYSSKDIKDESLVKSETLRALFNQKCTDYEEALHQKAQKENEKLIELVESGHFDEMITTQWVKATLMSTRKTTEPYFKGERLSDEHLTFRFTVPFDRVLPKTKTLKRTHQRFEGVGNHCMNLSNNIVDAFKKRYLFFENAHLFGEPSMDYQAREGVFNSDTHRFIPDTLTFGFQVDWSIYVSRKDWIFEWLASSYGVLPIEEILKDMEFHEDGISKKIEDYVHHHQEGNISTQQPFKIILGQIETNQLRDLYKASPLFVKSKELFEEEHQDEFWSYSRMKEAYKVAKKEEFQSLKLANLFAHALLVHPLYAMIKETLKALDYELTIEYKKEDIKKMATGNTNIKGNDIPADVCIYSVQLVIK